MINFIFSKAYSNLYWIFVLNVFGPLLFRERKSTDLLHVKNIKIVQSRLIIIVGKNLKG